MKSSHYERLFLLNRCLEQVVEVLKEFQQEKLIHPEYAKSRKRATEDLRSDLSGVITGLLWVLVIALCRKPLLKGVPPYVYLNTWFTASTY